MIIRGPMRHMFLIGQDAAHKEMRSRNEKRLQDMRDACSLVAVDRNNVQGNKNVSDSENSSR